MTVQPRQTAGQPTGGQFAAAYRDESASELLSVEHPQWDRFEAARNGMWLMELVAATAAYDSIAEIGRAFGATAADYHWLHDGEANRLCFICFRGADGKVIHPDADNTNLLDELGGVFADSDSTDRHSRWEPGRGYLRYDFDNHPQSHADHIAGQQRTRDQRMESLAIMRETIEAETARISIESTIAGAKRINSAAATLVLSTDGWAEPIALLDADGNTVHAEAQELASLQVYTRDIPQRTRNGMTFVPGDTGSFICHLDLTKGNA